MTQKLVERESMAICNVIFRGLVDTWPRGFTFQKVFETISIAFGFCKNTAMFGKCYDVKYDTRLFQSEDMPLEISV